MTVLALSTKTIATWIGSRLGGIAAKAGFHLAVVLNARGVLGIVLAAIGLEAELINGKAFSTLIVLSVVTSLIAGTWLQWVKKRYPEQLDLGDPPLESAPGPEATEAVPSPQPSLVESGPAPRGG